MGDWDAYALLLIDVQRDFYDPSSIAPGSPAFPANVGRLLTTCRSSGIEVIHVRSRFQPDMSDWMARYRMRRWIPCIDGTPGVEPLSVAVALPGELVVEKQKFDAFLGTDLDARLREGGKRFVFVAGLVTSTCVLISAAAATQLGYLVALVEDCCADRPEVHEQVLQTYPFIFSRTHSTRVVEDRPEWEAQLRGLATSSSP